MLDQNSNNNNVNSMCFFLNSGFFESVHNIHDRYAKRVSGTRRVAPRHRDEWINLTHSKNQFSPVLRRHNTFSHLKWTLFTLMTSIIVSRSLFHVSFSPSHKKATSSYFIIWARVTGQTLLHFGVPRLHRLCSLIFQSLSREWLGKK